MPARPLHCKYCQGIFLPASEQTWSAVQCPHCSGQMQVRECTAAETPAVREQEYHPVTEQQEAAARVEATQRRWSGRMVFLACALPLAGLAAWGVMRAWQVFSDPAQKQKDQKDRAAALLAAGHEERGAALALARQFLHAETWQDLLPLTADEERVTGMMEWYYSTHPAWQPVAGTVEVVNTERLESDGRAMMRVQAATPERTAIWLLLVREGEVWKVDWEVFANANVARWAAFVREPAGAAAELPLLVALKPAGEAYVVRAGATPGKHRAVVMWALERQALAGAVLANDSPLWRDLAEMDFENAVKVIAQVTMVDPQAEPPLVKVSGIVQRGWMRGVQKPVAGRAPGP